MQKKGVLFGLLVVLSGAFAAPTITTIVTTMEAESATEPIKQEQTKKPFTEEEKFQNEHAQYHFSTKIDDRINDLTNERNEIRNGLSVEGHYSYSDGYTKRTVYYVADDKGYRVIKTLEEPLDPEGPTVNFKGTASVSTMAHGKQVSYKVQSVPAEGPVQKIVGDSTDNGAPLPQDV